MKTETAAPLAVFLTTWPERGHNDNGIRLPRAFAAAGWRVVSLPHEALHVVNGAPFAGETDLAEAALVWPVGFGPRASYFDRAQLLSTLPPGRLINDPAAALMLHGKFGFDDSTPETYAAFEPGPLLARLARGGAWVLKPAAASFGRGVVPVHDDEAGRAAVIDAFRDGDGGAMLLQRRIDTGAPELRTLMVNTHIVGTYARHPADGLRANLARGATAAPGALRPGQRRLVERVMDELVGRGIRFAAIDVLDRWLVEVNVANPGGLATLAALYGGDPAREVAEHFRDRIASDAQ